jgi:hypothetical protein
MTHASVERGHNVVTGYTVVQHNVDATSTYGSSGCGSVSTSTTGRRLLLDLGAAAAGSGVISPAEMVRLIMIGGMHMELGGTCSWMWTARLRIPLGLNCCSFLQ